MKKIECETLLESTELVSVSIANKLQEDIKHFGEASLVLTGGSTVRPFLSELCKIDVPWNKIWVILSDERWVSLGDSMSNEKQLCELFLDKLEMQCQYISLRSAYITISDAVDDLQKKIAAIKRPFSCSLLSIGDDGHIASLFPSEIAQWQASKARFFHSKFKGDRLSLNWPLLQMSQENFLLLKADRQFNDNNIRYLESILGENTNVIHCG